MKTIVTYLKNAYQYLTKHPTLILVCVIIVLIFLLSFQCQRKNNLKNEVNKSEQNISALNDTITIVKKKNGALNFSIDGFVATTKELKTLNKSLYDQVKDQSGKVLSLNNAVITLTQDKTELQKYIDVLKSNTNQVNQLNDSTYLVPWTLAYKYDQDNSDLFVGQTLMRLNVKNKLKLQQLNSELIKRETNIGLTFGQKVEDVVFAAREKIVQTDQVMPLLQKSFAEMRT